MAERDDLDVTATAAPTSHSVGTDTTVGLEPAVRYDDLPDDGLPVYRVTGELGRGGMGHVMRAEDPRLGREVAVKRLISSAAGARARFEREARITARLQHPAIVPIYEAGIDANGIPFYAMRLITGRTLADAIRATTTLDERLGLLRNVIAVAEALAYAHSRRVIHRDLKASNVVVGEFGETIVIDWGLAKDLAASDAPELPTAPTAEPAVADGELTCAGAVMGTPAYMPPEQAEGDPVDERADVYALGVMLYHLLAGQMPYRAKTAVDVLAALRAGPPEPITQRVAGVPSDLAAIIAKGMARAPADRYPTAKEMALELERFEAGQLVASHAYTRRELLARWIHRHRTAVIVGLVALVTTGVGGAMAIEEIVEERRHAEHERDVAVQARSAEVARADEAVLARARDLVDEQPRGALEQLRELSAGSPQWARARAIAADAMARGVVRRVGQLGDAGLQLAVGRDGTTLATSAGELLWTRPGGGRWITPATKPALAADGSAYAWLDGDQAVIGDGTRVAGEPPWGRHRVSVPAGTTGLAVTPGGAAVFAITGDRVYRIAVPSGTRRDLGAAPAGFGPADVSSAMPGFVVAAASARREGKLTRVARAWRYDGTELVVPRLSMAAEAPGGALIALVIEDRVIVRDVARGTDATVASGLEMASPRIGAGGRWLAWSQLSDPVVHLRDLQRSKDFELRGHTGLYIISEFSSDGRWLATAGGDGHVRLWDLEVLAEEQPKGALPRAEPTLVVDASDTVHALAFASDGALIALTEGGAVLRWALPTVVSRRNRGPYRSTDLTWEAHVHAGEAVVIRVADRLRRALPGVTDQFEPGDPITLAFAADPQVVAVAGRREVMRWQHERGTVDRFPIDGDVIEVAIAPAGDQLIALTRDGTAWLAGVGPTRTLATGFGITGARPRFASDGRHVGLHARAARLFRVADGAELPVPAGRYLAFTRDGRGVAIASELRVERCELASLRCDPLDDSQHAAILTFGPAGELAATRRGLEVVMWAADTRTPTVVGRHRAGISRIAFSPDGKSLVTSGQGPEVQLIDVATTEHRRLFVHDDPVGARHDGDRVWVTDWFRTYQHPDDLPRDEAGLRARIEQLLE